MTSRLKLSCLILLCGFSCTAFAQDSRALIFRLAEGAFLEILPNGNATLSGMPGEDPDCKPTGPGFLDFESLYREFKSTASERQHGRSDTLVTFTVGGGRSYYLQDRTRVLEQFRKTRNWIARFNPRNSCPEIPSS